MRDYLFKSLTIQSINEFKIGALNGKKSSKKAAPKKDLAKKVTKKASAKRVILKAYKRVKKILGKDGAGGY